MKTIKKMKQHAFGKDVYLLGEYKTGERVWLEAATWDCEWYWGFGYIETYRGNKYPENAADIDSHSHYDGLVWHKDRSNDYIYHINMHEDFKSTTLTDKEAWELSDLMKTFYTLRKAAETYHRGNSNFSTPGISIQDKELAERINKIDLPKVFNCIYKLLGQEVQP